MVSVNAGRVATLVDERGRPFVSGIAKAPVGGPVRVGPRGIEGDESATYDRGDGDTALHAFAAPHYTDFESRFGRPLAMPSFGENLDLEGYGEAEARIGDVLRIGSALLRVTQPTVRCRRPGSYAGAPELGRWMLEGGRTGFYLAVVAPGTVCAGDPVALCGRGRPALSVARLNRAFAGDVPADWDAEEVLAAPELAERYKALLRRALGAKAPRLAV